MNGTNEAVKYMRAFEGKAQFKMEGHFCTWRKPQFMIFYDYHTDTISVELFTCGGQDNYIHPLDNCILLIDEVLNENIIEDVVSKYKSNAIDRSSVINYVYDTYFPKLKKNSKKSNARSKERTA